MNADEKKFVVVVVTIIILFVIISRTNVAQTKTHEALFIRYDVVVFRTPIEGENITAQTIQFLIDIVPAI